MVGALADILRYTVKNAGGTASISEEIAWLKQYIMLQSAKFGKRLDVKIYMPEDVKECRIHKLLLQPFVENTIKYAFADQEECALNIRMKKSGEQLHILIQDNGQGMDPDMVDKLNQDECEMEGHLGIANVRKRLKLYYGDRQHYILKVKLETIQSTLIYTDRGGNYMRIVVVEDEAPIREGMAKLLSKINPEYELVGKAADGEAGYQLIRELNPDLVIMDIRMPKMDGITMMKKLREENIKCKAIILSAYSEFQYAQKAIELKADSYLLKPIKIRN